MKHLIFALCLIPMLVEAQGSFPPQEGFVGSNAIHKDSNLIRCWATQCVVTRGWQDASDTALGYVTAGADSFAYHRADGTTVTLGDGGSAIVQFANPISDGPGPDIAVFENGFTNFLELAHVEVSSDGINFVRFPSVSEIPDSAQVGPFDFTDASYIHNLAGKYHANYGTPFDLYELNGRNGLDIQNITHVKIIDVVGSIDPFWGSTDSTGKYINEPFPTAFPTGGFDLDAVACLQPWAVGTEEPLVKQIRVFPTATREGTTFVNPLNERFEVHLYALSGAEIFTFELQPFETRRIPLTQLHHGFVTGTIIDRQGATRIVKLIALD